MITEEGWGFRRTRRGIYDFTEATREDMVEFGNKIKDLIEQLEDNIIQIQRLMSTVTEGFSETVENFLQFSKFSYKDTMVLTSALHLNSHILITIDEQFKKEASRITELEEERESLPQDFLKKSGFITLKFNPPVEFSPVAEIKGKYKEWFSEHNKEKIIGKVINYWRRARSCAVECINNYKIKEGDYIYLVKFSSDNDIIKKSVKVEENCLRDFDTEENIKEGGKVTIKLPKDFSFNRTRLNGAMVFLSE